MSSVSLPSPSPLQRSVRVPQDVPLCGPRPRCVPAIAFDGMSFSLGDLPWLPFLTPVLEAALGRDPEEEVAAAEAAGAGESLRAARARLAYEGRLEMQARTLG